jgi:hypothetical protein
MANDFLSMLAAAFLAVVVVYAAKHALRKLTGYVLPKWVMPAAAGLSMLGYTIYAEYSWYPTVRNGLPPSVAVLRTVEDSAPWRPWTYVAPLTTRFMALDLDKLRHPAPGIVEGELMLIARWTPIQQVSVAYDCTNAARADLVEGARIDDGGVLSGAEWRPIDATDEGLKAACNGG